MRATINQRTDVVPVWLAALSAILLSHLSAVPACAADAPYKVLVFSREGGGYVGVHAAADTEYDWPFYGTLVGARFASHPVNQQCTVNIEDRSHPATAHLATTWTRSDEWYNYRTNPRTTAHVLMSLNESSYF